MTLGASAATQPAEGLPAIAEQLELLFEAPPAAPGRPATIPSRTPNRSGSGPAGAKSTHRREKTGSERQSDGFAEPNRYLAFPDDGGRTNGAGTPNGVAIPARCPVVNRPVCYRADCHHYQHGGCAHPEAVRPERRRRR